MPLTAYQARIAELLGRTGCLRLRWLFVGRFDAAEMGNDIVLHYGRPGGVLPKLG